MMIPLLKFIVFDMHNISKRVEDLTKPSVVRLLGLADC